MDAPPAKKRRPFVILGIVAAAVLAAIGLYFLLTLGEEGTDDAQVQADVVPVAARVSAQVRHVPIKENQQVHKGDLLVELDDAEYQARLKQSEAESQTAQAQAQAADAQVAVVEASSKGGLVSARAVVHGSSASVASADAQVAAARAALVRAQADQSRAEIDLSRARKMIGSGAISQQALDNAQISFDSAVAAQAQSRAQVAAAEEAKRVAQTRVVESQGRLEQSTPIEQQIDIAHANAALAHARVKSAEAALELARLQLGYTRITAPADGIASKLSVHEGQLLQVGQTVAELVPNQTYVVANFKETQVGRMHPGQRAEVEIDGFPGRKLEGRVESLSGGTGASFSVLPPDNASGNFVKVVQRVPVRIVWVNPPADLALRAGLSADVTVYTR